jgi:hypothetical protein
MERLAMVGHDKLLISLVSVAPSTGTNAEISKTSAPSRFNSVTVGFGI